MKELSCDDVLMAQMATADGEKIETSQDQLEAHIAGCANCQHQLMQMQVFDQSAILVTLFRSYASTSGLQSKPESKTE